MADSSLDDFFAKKDKSKKSKKKFTTSDQIARKLEESGKKSTDMAATTKKEKEKVVIVPTSTSSTVPGPTIAEQCLVLQEDDEWRDFEVEKEKDYTGLKIQNMQISDSKEDENEKDRILEDEDGEPMKARDNSYGPWNKSSATPSSAVIPERPDSPPVIEEPEKKDDQPKTGVYRPPHARLTPGLPSANKMKQQSKIAPEISSELHFPSLSAAADTPKGSKKGGDRTPDSEKGFDLVKRGSRTTEETHNRGPKLDLGNKYNALSYGDMS